MKYPFVSIVIPNHNGWERGSLEVCLDSLMKLNYPNFEVIFVDNCSIDDSVKNVQNWCRENKFNVYVINNTENNVAKAINLGIKISRGKYISVFSDDTEATRDALKQIIRIMEEDEQIGVAMFRLMDYFNRDKIDTVGDSFDFYGNAELIGYGEIYRGQYNSIREVLAVGAAYVFRKEIVKKIGYFDEMFHVGYEDGDFCIRARLHGYKVICASTAVVFHRRGSSYQYTSKESKKILDYIKFNFYKGQLILLIKNYELKNLIKSLPNVLFMHLLIALYQSFFQKKPKDGLLRVKAVLWVMYHIHYLLRQRCAVQKQVRRVPDTEIIKYMSENQYLKHLKLLGK